MRKYGVFIWMLFAVVACQKNEMREEERKEEREEGHVLSLSGEIVNMNVNESGASSFKLQLVRGEIDATDFDENDCHPEAQVFITGKGKSDFEFTGLQEGKYTLFVSKNGYKSHVKTVLLRRYISIPLRIIMEKGDAGFSDKIQILDEEGNDLSEIRINRNSTMSVYFYLYNGKGVRESYHIRHIHNDGYLGKSFIIDGEIVHLYSNWVKEIKPSSGTLDPNEITLIEAVIDPLVYLLKEHSGCNIYINEDLRLKLSY